MLIRPETPADFDAIYQITAAAFAPMKFSDGTEAALTDDLRRDGDLTLSLVGERDGEIIAHIAFSPVTIAGVHDNWFGLGPVSVRPEAQGQGLGRAIITAGLDRMRAKGVAGVALTGNPAIYGKFGFEGDCGLTHEDTPPRLVQRVVFHGAAPLGELAFAPAFTPKP